jgi:hypothetical protein
MIPKDHTFYGISLPILECSCPMSISRTYRKERYPAQVLPFAKGTVGNGDSTLMKSYMNYSSEHAEI